MIDPTSAKLAIVIPSHRRADLLARCLESVTRFAPTSTDVVVVDDGSRDAVISRTAQNYPGVRVLRFPKARGFCHAANAGIRATSTPFIELLNDDTEVCEHWTERALIEFDDASIGAVAPLLLLNDGRIDSAGDMYDVGGFAHKRSHGTRSEQEAGDVFGACGAAAFYRRSALDRTGLFPESFGAYFEDVDLSFRLHWAGYRVKYQPSSKVFHVGGSSYGKKSRRLIERQSCNEERVYWRNLPNAMLWRSLPRHCAVLIGKALRRWQEGTFLPFVVGRLRVLSEIGEIVRHRRKLRAMQPHATGSEWCVATAHCEQTHPSLK